MSVLHKPNIQQAEIMRYAKIQNAINLLQGNGSSIAAEAVWSDTSIAPFKVGRFIVIDDETIHIGKKTYNLHDMGKVVINTEGSMSIYNSFRKKICGCLRLNVSLNNIELFCVWIHKNKIPVEIVSGKRERIFQYAVLTITVAAVLLFTLLKYL